MCVGGCYSNDLLLLCTAVMGYISLCNAVKPFVGQPLVNSTPQCSFLHGPLYSVLAVKKAISLP